MKFCRFRLAGNEAWGVIDDDDFVTALPGAPWESPEPRRGAVREALVEVELLVPTLPTKILCVGQNYRKHAAEMGKPVPEEPLLFLKPPSALNAHQNPIELPPASAEVHHESELALVIGRTLRNATEAEAAEAIFGITCFNDVTARDIQRREVQHTRGKGYDTFACVGPWMVTGLPFSDLRIQCRVNGESRQDGRTSDMIFPPARLVSFMSQVMTLEPGDLIVTGTPSGVGPLKAGDTVEVEIEGIGILENPVEGPRV